jgi:hypothetical protein
LLQHGYCQTTVWEKLLPVKPLRREKLVVDKSMNLHTEYNFKWMFWNGMAQILLGKLTFPRANWYRNVFREVLKWIDDEDPDNYNLVVKVMEKQERMVSQRPVVVVAVTESLLQLNVNESVSNVNSLG